MRCPTCRKDGLLITAKFCPRCETQITSDYETIDSAEKIYMKEHSLLKGKVVELAQKKERVEQKNSRLKGYMMVLGLIFFSFLMFKKSPAPEIIEVDNSDAIEELKQALKISSDSISILKEKLDLRTPQFIKYKIRRGDNLTKISNLFYNDPTLLEKVAKENKIRIPDKISEGDTLEIIMFR